MRESRQTLVIPDVASGLVIEAESSDADSDDVEADVEAAASGRPARTDVTREDTTDGIESASWRTELKVVGCRLATP